VQKLEKQRSANFLNLAGQAKEVLSLAAVCWCPLSSIPGPQWCFRYRANKVQNL